MLCKHHALCFYFLHFFHIEILGKFNPKKIKREKLFEFTLGKKIPKISQFICQTSKISPGKKKKKDW
jgi:hypothetical protein